MSWCQWCGKSKCLGEKENWHNNITGGVVEIETLETECCSLQLHCRHRWRRTAAGSLHSAGSHPSGGGTGAAASYLHTIFIWSSYLQFFKSSSYHLHIFIPSLYVNVIFISSYYLHIFISSSYLHVTGTASSSSGNWPMGLRTDSTTLTSLMTPGTDQFSQ